MLSANKQREGKGSRVKGSLGVRIVWGIFGLGACRSLIQTPSSGLPFHTASACSTEAWHIRRTQGSVGGLQDPSI